MMTNKRCDMMFVGGGGGGGDDDDDDDGDDDDDEMMAEDEEESSREARVDGSMDMVWFEEMIFGVWRRREAEDVAEERAERRVVPAARWMGWLEVRALSASRGWERESGMEDSAEDWDDSGSGTGFGLT